MLRQRIISALVMAPPALLAAYVGSWLFGLMIAAAAGIMAWEWQRLCTGRYDAAGVALGVLGAVAALAGLRNPALAAACVLLAVPLVAAVSRRGDGDAGWMALGTVYVGLPVIALTWLRGDGDAGRATLLWLLLAVWATDIGAYAAGRLIGGPKLAPAISPNKTWAGLLGGMASAGLVGLAFGFGFDLDRVWPLLLISLVTAAVAQGGDLFESWVKRRFGVKDSSSIIPGHGGLLDRVDGLLAAAPLAAVTMAVYGGGVTSWQ